MQPTNPGSTRIPIATRIATTQCGVADPDLGALIDAWPELPMAIKAGILAMVRTSLKGAAL
jgi:hypothetical protein